MQATALDRENVVEKIPLAPEMVQASARGFWVKEMVTGEPILLGPKKEPVASLRPMEVRYLEQVRPLEVSISGLPLRVVVPLVMAF